MMDYNIRDGRTYMYFKGKPLYPFGYGLSYTTFKYTNLKLNSETLTPEDGTLHRHRRYHQHGHPRRRRGRTALHHAPQDSKVARPQGRTQSLPTCPHRRRPDNPRQ